ncbi:lipopolysaccharide biosynthesis protein [Cytobacillus gottheilii]|uniref:lipopolysaccharide biosynthesis protein n=1 Tax=Cytobacillus gottheilii TaxID=859144 RepID=UPI00083050D7|nr:oligosaccharide flippase family protein [Cytobacillus gottheilii]
MDKLKVVLKNNFVQGIIVIAGGTAAAQIINALFAPIITRVYSPEDFGILTLFAAILGILAIISSFKYESGVAIADDEKKAINVLVLSVIILVFFVLTTFFILHFVGDYIFKLFTDISIPMYQILIPLGVFLTGLYTIFTQWALRTKNYKTLSKTKLTQSLVQNLTKIVLGTLSFGPVGLIFGNILGQSLGITKLSSPLTRNKKTFFSLIDRKIIYWCAKRYIRFPLYSAPSQLLNNLGLQLPILFMTTLYGSATIGYYGLANTIVNLPMNLIGRSVADVFYAEAASAGREDPMKLKKLARKVFHKLFLIGIIPSVILLFLGPYLFSVVFGDIWYESGVYSRIIAILVFSRLVFTPITKVFSVFEKQKDELVFDILKVILILLVYLIVLFFSLNSYWFVGLYSGIMSIIYCLTFQRAMKIINKEIEKRQVINI